MRSGLRGTTCVALGEIRAGKLRKLHAKQRPGWLVGLTWVEVFLNDLVGRASRKRVAFARQIGACYRFCNSPKLVKIKWHSCRWQTQAFKAAINQWRTVCCRSSRDQHRSAGRIPHTKHTEHIAHSIGYRNGRQNTLCLGFSHALGNNFLYVTDRQRFCLRGSTVT